MIRQKITSRRDLAEELADVLDMASDEMSVFVDLTAQNVLLHVPLCIAGVSDAEADGHEVVYMESFGSSEAFDVMEDFARSRPDDKARPLFEALSRKRPFKMFRLALERTNQLQDWYAFKVDAYVGLAESRLEAEGIDVVDGKIVCADKSAITIYEAEDADDDDVGEDDE
jgi:hypothetical protein